MPIANMLINDASGHKVIITLDGNASYNQIFLKQPLDVRALLVCLNALL
jgi:hypothetical protein